jgi:hypothetical protein
MVTATMQKEKAKRRPYGSMRQAAAALGVSRQHLHLVLVGERRSPRIERSHLFKHLRRAS